MKTNCENMDDKTAKLLQSIKPSKIIFPIIIGLAVVLFFIVRDFKVQDISVLNFSYYTLLFLLFAFLLMAFRDIGYMIRIRVLSDGELSWRQTFRIVMLWEFTSAVSPSAVGGTAIATLFVAKEGISVGRSASIVLTTSFLDELYFVITFPLLILLLQGDNLFGINAITNVNGASFANEFFLIAFIGYALKFVYIVIITYGLFINPRGLKWLLLLIFKLPILRKWRQDANLSGTEIILSSRQFRRRPFSFWLKAFGATVFSWTSRYWVGNAVLAAFLIVPDHVLLFARQLVIWIMMLVSPTPGGSGLAEAAFAKYLSDLIIVDPSLLAGVAIAMALLWRVITYYPYLIIGAIILPTWIKEKFGSEK